MAECQDWIDTYIELGKGVFTLKVAKDKTECLNIHDVIE